MDKILQVATWVLIKRTKITQITKPSYLQQKQSILIDNLKFFSDSKRISSINKTYRRT